MDIHSSLSALPEDASLAIGIFDGVHRGHRAVIEATGPQAPRGVLTFDPHPSTVVGNRKTPKRFLTTLEHKKRILADLGLDFLIVLEFNPARAAQTADSFTHELFETGIRRVAVGEDWRFGAGRKGSAETLIEAGRRRGVKVIAVPQIDFEGERISSTRIREALEHADFSLVESLLSRPYSVLGSVVPGQKLGRQLGFPTANLKIKNEFLPPNAVYAVRGRLDHGPWWPGVANVGLRPTVQTGDGPLLEVHFLHDAIPDLYGKNLEIAFLKKLRDERKFPDLPQLRAQISRDAEAAQKFLAQP